MIGYGREGLYCNIPGKLEIDKTVTRQAIQTFQLKMQDKMGEAHEKGKGYWWNNQICKIEFLEDSMNEALREKDYVSVANYAMMLDARKQMSEEYDAFFGSVYPDLAKQAKEQREKEVENWKESFKPDDPRLDDLAYDGHD